MELINNLDEMLQILCDPENQPHQFIGDAEGLKESFKVKNCSCIEPPINREDTIIRICGQCNCIVSGA